MKEPHNKYRKDYRLIHDLEGVKDGSNNHHINTLLMKYNIRVNLHQRGKISWHSVQECEKDMRRTLVRERVSKTLPCLLASAKRAGRRKTGIIKRIIQSIFGLFKSKK